MSRIEDCIIQLAKLSKELNDKLTKNIIPDLTIHTQKVNQIRILLAGCPNGIKNCECIKEKNVCSNFKESNYRVAVLIKGKLYYGKIISPYTKGYDGEITVRWNNGNKESGSSSEVSISAYKIGDKVGDKIICYINFNKNNGKINITYNFYYSHDPSVSIKNYTLEQIEQTSEAILLATPTATSTATSTTAPKVNPKGSVSDLDDTNTLWGDLPDDDIIPVPITDPALKGPYKFKNLFVINSKKKNKPILLNIKGNTTIFKFPRLKYDKDTEIKEETNYFIGKDEFIIVQNKSSVFELLEVETEDGWKCIQVKPDGSYLFHTVK